MILDIYQVDAFTDKTFGGNPAAVCPLEAWLPDMQLQNIAMENNLSETAFFIPSQSSDADFDLRWFTPSCEVDLCGHATLATSFIIFDQLKLDKPTIRFSTRSGILTIEQTEYGLKMNLPVWDYKETDIPLLVTEALGAKPTALYKGNDWIALFDDEQTVRDLEPDMDKLLQIKDMRGILPTAKSNGKYDFISRFFGPAVGVPEDPVTGSAHCILTPFWAERLNKTTLHAYQASARGGALFCELKGDRVHITGQAVLYMTGQINV